MFLKKIDGLTFSECMNCFGIEQTGVLLQNQQLLYNGMEVRNSEKLSAIGVKDDDMIMMVSNAVSRYAAFARILNSIIS